MPDPIAPSSCRGALALDADACDVPPDDLVGSSDTALPPSSMPPAPVAEHPFFDYVTLSLGVGAVIGVSLSATVDREGHVYVAAALGVGFGPTIGTVSLVAGHLLDGPRASGPSAPTVIEGDSVNANVAYGPSLGITSYPGGTAVELGVGSPQFGASFEHAWEINGTSGAR